MTKTQIIFYRFKSALRDEGGWWPILKKTLYLLRRHGLGFTLFGGLHATGSVGVRQEYQYWAQQLDTLGQLDVCDIESSIADLTYFPKFSIILPTFNSDLVFLKQAIQSVEDQIYPHWELCIADDASQSPELLEYLKKLSLNERVRINLRSKNGHISAASNSALELASGDWVVPLDHDDLLSKDALYQLALAINNNPAAKLIYSDEDKIDVKGRRFSPYFKPDFNYELLRGNNYICHITCFKRDMLEEVGGYREGFEGAQDHDLLLRFIERCNRQHIVHIPLILYHWRWHQGSTAAGVGNKDYASLAGEKAVREHIDRVGLPGKVVSDRKGAYAITYDLPDVPPSVEIIIPTKNNAELIRACVTSVLEKTRYPNFKIAIIDNGSDDAATKLELARLDRLPNVAISSDPRPFNFAQLNNGIAASSTADFLLLLNDDTEVIYGNWLSDMVALAVRSDSGAVGAKLLYSDRTVQHAGVVVGIGAAAGHVGMGMHQDDTGYYFRSQISSEFSAVTGACLLVSRDKYQQVGGMDEKRYKVAFNDIDLCLKLRRAGYVNYLCATAVLYHYESKSRGFDTEGEKLKRFHGEVSRFRKDWYQVWESDPYYNPHLTRNSHNFEQDYGVQWRHKARKAYGMRCRAAADALSLDLDRIALINARLAEQIVPILYKAFPEKESSGEVIFVGENLEIVARVLSELRPNLSLILSASGRPHAAEHKGEIKEGAVAGRAQDLAILPTEIMAKHLETNLPDLCFCASNADLVCWQSVSQELNLSIPTLAICERADID